MKPSILLIEPDTSIQTSVSLAADKFSAKLHILNDGSKALQAVETVCPDIILCAADVVNFEPFSLCDTIRADPQTALTFVAILVPKNEVGKFAAPAVDHGVDEILAKPFKPEQIQRLIERLLAQRNAERKQQSALMLLKDSFLQRLLGRLLDKQEITYELCDNVAEAKAFTKSSHFSALIVEWEAVENLDWYKPDEMGELLLIIPRDTQLKSINKHERVRIITRPLSFSQLSPILEDLLPFDTDILHSQKKQLDQGAQAMLAARAAASIFERLVSHNALRDGDWNSAGQAALEELLRICQAFEGRFPMK